MDEAAPAHLKYAFLVFLSLLTPFCGVVASSLCPVKSLAIVLSSRAVRKYKASPLVCAVDRLGDILRNMPDNRSSYGLQELRTASFLTLDDILEWTAALRPQDKFCRATTRLQASHTVPNRVFENAAASCVKDSGLSKEQVVGGRLMVCHDYGGGYWEDRYYQGFYGNETYFQMFDWDLMHSFVYFTHDRLSVPPPGWINVGHKHGTKVLGTFLVEGNRGDPGFKECLWMLRDLKTQKCLIDQFVEICVFFGFDGYLLNFEVALVEEEDVAVMMQALLNFVVILRERLQSRLPHAVVFWYDSITVESHSSKAGALDWRDCLDDANLAFFNKADGILTNYFWKNDTLPRDLRNATTRNLDLFKGIDIYGRGTHAYSAGLDCLPAMHRIQEGHLSCGLFAPGYFYQECPTHKSPVEYSKEFWRGVLLCCSFFGMNTFRAGTGAGFFMEGRKVSEEPWFDLSTQDVLPLGNHTYDKENGFSGGGCLSLSATSDATEKRPHYFPLYETHFYLDSNTRLSLVYSSDASIGLSVRLSKKTSDVHPTTIIVSSSMASEDILKIQEEYPTLGDCHSFSTTVDIQEFEEESDIVVSPSANVTWKKISVLLEASRYEDCVMDSIGVVGFSTEQSPFMARIGQIVIASAPESSVGPLEILPTHVHVTPDAESDHNGWRLLDCQLEWITDALQTAVFVQTVFANDHPSTQGSVFLGRTSSQHGFWVKSFRLPKDATGVNFRIRCLTVQGTWTSPQDSPVCFVRTEVERA